jgi:bacillithiol biosynthesis cysteine-adding enzyme BshC
MPTDCISYQDSGYFIPLMNDYLDQQKHLKPLYNRFPSIENFKDQIAEKEANYPDSNREILHSVLTKQYSQIAISDSTTRNIEAIKELNTFTVTTGHQLNLFTGPLYFLYKIISTINLTKELKQAYSDRNFVPIYWMATEDHDFEEINYFNFKGKKFRWNKESFGPVGRLSTQGLEEVLAKFSGELGLGQNAEQLKKIFEEAYLKHDTLSEATRYLANQLFGSYGLVILDADDKDLKKLFIPCVRQELLHQTSHQKVAETSKLLSDYKIQVNPREINLFYIEDDLRERIILEDTTYFVNKTEIKFTEKQILRELEIHPEKFSPNVIMRPLYQEVILPNLCYIGGGGEIAYWLELKSYFTTSKITFPILLLRNSALLATEKQAEKADKLNLTWRDLFLNQLELKSRVVKKESDFNLDFSEQKMFLEAQFAKLKEIAQKTDASFIGAVKAQEKKQLKGLNNLEKRLIKAEKKKYAEKLNKIIDLQNELFPHEGLQERKLNFSEFYLISGNRLIEGLMQELKPLALDFTINIVHN